MDIFGMITQPFTALLAVIVPALYATAGFTSDWNILYDPVLRSRIFLITVIVSTVANLLAVIPWHFYDLTNEKFDAVTQALRERAEAKNSEREASEA